MKRIRPAFRVDLKVRIRRADGSTTTSWLSMPETFDANNIECALSHAVDKAGDEVRRIAKRPEYDLVGALGADYHVINVRFVRLGVENEDDEG